MFEDESMRLRVMIVRLMKAHYLSCRQYFRRQYKWFGEINREDVWKAGVESSAKLQRVENWQ